MMSKRAKYTIFAAMLVSLLGVTFFTPALHAQNTAAQALQKAKVLERLPEYKGTQGSSPSYVYDPAWPQRLPHHWVIGDVGGIAVDKHDNIWVLHRPRSVADTDAGMQGPFPGAKDKKGRPISAEGFPRPFGVQSNDCCNPAPSILEFDQSGKLLQAWGGPGDPGFLDNKCNPQKNGCTWTGREHGIFVDQNDFVYIGGNNNGGNVRPSPWGPTFGNDSQILKFKTDGTFVWQIGTPGAKGPNSNDTNGGINGTPEPFWPADFVVDPKTNQLYIADGYGNRRVLIVDAATGKYIGHFGAYGQNPVKGENGGGGADVGEPGAVGEPGSEGLGSWPAEYKAGQMKPKEFRSPVHCAKLANDGLLYVCDRANDRIQIFKASEVGKPCSNPDGEVGKCGFVGEIHVAPATVGGTSGTVNFSPDPGQTCLFVADLGNDVVYVINRQNLTELNRIGGGGREGGLFHWPHMVAADSQGNLYVGEVDTASRAQRFLRFGPMGCSGTGNPNVGQFTGQ